MDCRQPHASLLQVSLLIGCFIGSCLLQAIETAEAKENNQNQTVSASTCGSHAQLPAGAGTVTVQFPSFAITLRDEYGKKILSSMEIPDGGVQIGVRDSAVPPIVFLDPAAPALVEWYGLGSLLSCERTKEDWQLVYDSEVGPISVVLSSDGTFAQLHVEGSSALPLPHAVMSLVLPASVREHYLGLGEQFDEPDSRGKVRPMQLRLDPTAANDTNEVHGPVSFLVSSRGWGMVVDNERPGAFDVAASREDALAVRYQDTQLNMAFTIGKPLHVVSAYARRAGLPRRPPDWALSLQQWRNDLPVAPGGFPTGRDLLLEDANALRELDVPASVIWIDAPWATGYNTFTFNPIQFPDYEEMLNQLNQLGFRVVVWASNYLNVSDDSDDMIGMPPYASLPLFLNFAEEGWLAKQPNGDPMLIPWWRGLGGSVDFTQPEARTAYANLALPLTISGIHGFKLDGGEETLVELSGFVNNLFHYEAGETSDVHLLYKRMYHLTFRSLLDELYGPDDGMLIVRSASHGNQSLGTIIWPGDLNNDFSRFGDLDEEGKWKVGGLPAAVSAAISLSASAFPYFASDTGGFQNGIPTSEALVRWIQFSALSPFFQLGGGGQNHNPWDSSLYPEPYVLPAFISYARLHGELFPYFRSLVEQAATKGLPIIRALGLMFPDDPIAWTIGDAYMLGDNLLVAPVIEQGAVNRAVYIPKGVWTDFWTGDTYTGPSWISVEAPLTADEYPIPLFMRVGSIVPMAAKDIDTLVPTSNPEIVTYKDREHFLRARVVPGDGDFTLWDKRQLRTHLRRNTLTLTSHHMKNNQLIWELDLKPWGISHNYKIFDKDGEFYSVPFDELEDCSRCYYFDGDRWLYISTKDNSRVLVRKT